MNDSGTTSKYNGHKNFNHWNVSLWINNEFLLYTTAKALLDFPMSCETAAFELLEWLHKQGITHTPDGVRYTKTTIKAALSSFTEE